MNKKLHTLYIIIPLIYVIFIIVFFLFHFLGKDPFKSETIGYLTISGAQSRGGVFSKKAITDLMAECGGFQLVFAGSSPVVLVYENSKRELCTVDSYTVFEKNVDIKYTNGLIITLRVAGETGIRTTVFIKKLPTQDRVAEILVRFFVKGTDIKKTVGIPIISCTSSFEQFFLSLSHTSNIDHYNNLLVLRGVEDNKRPGVTIEKGEKEYKDPYMFWYLTQTYPLTTTEYEQKNNEYLELSYNNWLSGRYDDEKSQWTGKDNVLFFDERIVMGMFSESFRRLSGEETSNERRDYRQVLSIADKVIDEQKRKAKSEGSGKTNPPGGVLPYLSSPFLGKQEQVVEALQNDDVRLLKKVETLILEENPAVFLVPHLFLLLLDRGNISQVDELVSRIVNTVDPDSVDLSVCLGMIDTYLDAALWLKAKEPFFEKYKDLMLTHILPNIKQTSHGLFLVEKERNVSYILLTIRLGALLHKMTQVTGDSDFAVLGQKCIHSTLTLGDEQGFLPGEIVIQSFDTIIPVGSIAMEEIYEYIAPGGYIPREIPLYPEFKPGMWIWTIARDVRTNRTGRNLTLTCSFPGGYSHYFFIQGIQPVSTLYFHDKKVDENPNFDEAREGWYYDSAIETLYVKLYHRNEEETLIIEYE